jgi:hypothetical protein
MASFVKVTTRKDWRLVRPTVASLGDLLVRFKAQNRRGKGEQKNRETQEEPTMLLIIKERFWEPTMFMKIQDLTGIGHDIHENKGL